MTRADLDAQAATQGLMIMGMCHDAGDTVILLGADALFWEVFRAAPEGTDGLAHPIDRWSKRVIGGFAIALGGAALFPSDGPPYAPFISWALNTGRFWSSPAGMMVHDRAGLMISIRGAIRLPGTRVLDGAEAQNPCLTCSDQPCASSCPVDALKGVEGYDVAACKSYLDTGPGQECMARGCKARRACPVSRSFGRDEAQSAFHMAAFHTPKTQNG